MSNAPVADGVTLASLHAAKGLEWDAVFLIGLASGLFPHREATLPAEIEEERRLFYVGLTRAREHLQLTWARARTPGQRASRSRSFFLDDALGAEVGSAAAGSVRRGAGGRKSSEAGRRRDPVPCRVCGRSLVTGVEAALGRCRTCPATYDEGLYDRLKEWRRGEASRIGKPAFVVFSDATLQAIAETLPNDEISLARISGLGPVKRDRWGACLLAMVRGEPVPDAIDPEPVDSDA
jgi:DNA helicase-2/ATP-dependent DNA helicase PcrA